MICTYCGKTNKDNARYCSSCGIALNSVKRPVLPNQHSSVEARSLHTGKVLAGRYVILRQLGLGGMGAVYLAEDRRIQGRQLAVKEMSEMGLTDHNERQAAIDAFQREAQLLAQLDHVNLPKVLDAFSENNRQYLVMEFVPGKTLEKRLEESSGPLPEHEVYEYAVQLCDVLDYLHCQQPPIIFRDLKPANIMLKPDGRIKLIDFGIARHFKPGKNRDTQAMGTPGYAAPEQYGKGQSDARTDIYALGATLHHAITGRDPGTEPFRFPPVRSYNSVASASFEQIVGRAVMLNPDDRWQSVREMQNALVGQPTGTANRLRTAMPSASQMPRPDLVYCQSASIDLSTNLNPAFTLSRKTLKFGQVNPGKRRWRYFHVHFQEQCEVEIHCAAEWVSVHPARLQGRKAQYSRIQVCADTRHLPDAIFQQFNTDVEVTNGSSREILNIRLTLVDISLQSRIINLIAKIVVATIVALSMTLLLLLACFAIGGLSWGYIAVLSFVASTMLVSVASMILRIQDVANLMVHVSKVSVVIQLPLFATLTFARTVLLTANQIPANSICAVVIIASLLIWFGVYINSMRNKHYWQF